MSAKITATIAVLIGWIIAFGMWMFLQTFDNAVMLWILAIAIIAFLPRETYRVWKPDVLTENEQALLDSVSPRFDGRIARGPSAAAGSRVRRVSSRTIAAS